LVSLISWVPLLPLIGFLVLGLLPMARTWSRGLIAGIASTAVGGAFIAAVLTAVGLGDQAAARSVLYTWSPLGSGPASVEIAFRADRLSLVMLLVVTGVSFLIHVYSAGYMAGDPGFRRYFAYLNLFVFAMCLLVAADNYLLLLIGWANVGLASFLLIGFWFTKPAAVLAARKALVVNVLGDAAIMLAIFVMFTRFGSVAFDSVLTPLASARFSDAARGDFILIAACLFVGAAAKSAQGPLYVWLPDAMEGPTPVSALIHAATMVTAGVYLVVRSGPLFLPAGGVPEAVAWVGAITALFAATVAIVQTDIKRVLAYSTVSQLGYMFMAAGLHAGGAAIFHLMTHAFFKACLFLAAGLVIHALAGEQDMWRMGGLWGRLRFAGIAFGIGALAISGVPPFAGFFSKDAILAATWDQGQYALWAIGIVTALLTAFYMFRAVFLVFGGSPVATGTGHDPAHSAPVGHEPAPHGPDNPPVMAGPVGVLALLSVVGGLVAIPGVWDLLENYLRPVLEEVSPGTPAVVPEWNVPTLIAAAGAAVLGIGGAWLVYGRQRPATDPLERAAPALYNLLSRQYYVERALGAVVVRPLEWLADAVLDRVDRGLFEGGVHGLAGGIGAAGQGLGRTQTGALRNYALVILLGMVGLLGYLLAFGNLHF
jgi:NADH-quinone oxidoreductase subunit L